MLNLILIIMFVFGINTLFFTQSNINHNQTEHENIKNKNVRYERRKMIEMQMPVNFKEQIQQVEEQLLKETKIIDQKYIEQELEMYIAKKELEENLEQLNNVGEITKEEAVILVRLKELNLQTRKMRRKKSTELQQLSEKYDEQLNQIQIDWLKTL